MLACCYFTWNKRRPDSIEVEEPSCPLMTDILSKVNHPQDLKPLSLEELEQLGREIRQRVLEIVDRNGGHLASNLGSVELTLALHKVFDVPNDRLVWDTSHQTYPHKLVTGRKDRFEPVSYTHLRAHET